jgi:hypothetical protein
MGKSGCDGGDSFSCLDQTLFKDPEGDENTAYGYAAVHVPGENPDDTCCKCFQLDFVDLPGKKLIVQGKVHQTVNLIPTGSH